MSMMRYVMDLGLVLLTMSGLVFIFSSCDREVSDVAPGEPVKLRFLANEIGYGANKNVTRSAGSRVLESVDIARQGRWTISADLLEDDCSLSRAVSDGLVDGAKVLIVVYDNNDDYQDSDVYTFNSSSKALDDAEGDGITVTGGSTYRFVARTYNRTDSVPTYAVTISGISPTYDLLYGKTGSITISSANIDFSVSHQFMKVRLTTTVSGDNAPEFSNLKASFMTNYKADLTVLSGLVAKGDTAHYAFTAADPGSNLGTIPNDSLISDYGVVYSGGDNPFYVKIDSLTLSSGSTLTDMVASFTTPLLPGHSYTLQINFKRGVAWAGSNIYWDAEKECLTFKEAGYKGPENYYQGVFFQFGSLVGVSPARLPSDENFDGGTNGDPSSGTPIYVWSSVSSQWIQTNVATAYSETLGGFSGSGYTDIPYTTTGYDDDRTVNRLYGAGGDFATNRGDICEYIGAKGSPQGYRMAKSIEFAPERQEYAEWSSDIPDTGFGWIRFGTASWAAVTDSSHPGGTLSITNGGSYQGYPFPASGYRNLGGTLYTTGDYGNYWSGSGLSFYAHGLDFESSYARPYYSTDRQQGFSVRCVLRE
jgi:hypothetical protein